jgi:hypothetical protein
VSHAARTREVLVRVDQVLGDTPDVADIRVGRLAAVVEMVTSA